MAPTGIWPRRPIVTLSAPYSPRTNDGKRGFQPGWPPSDASIRILAAFRRIILVSASRRCISAIDAFAMVELPPARRWEARDLVIVGQQFCVTPHEREIIRGDTAGRHAVRLVPLLSDSEGEPDGWVVL